MDILVRIKLLVVADKVVFTVKAGVEMESEGLTPDMVYESILNASTISKTLRSRNPETGEPERLHVIKGLTDQGLRLYTKGRIRSRAGRDVFYVLVSSKRDTDG